MISIPRSLLTDDSTAEMVAGVCRAEAAYVRDVVIPLERELIEAMAGDMNTDAVELVCTNERCSHYAEPATGTGEFPPHVPCPFCGKEMRRPGS